MTRDELLATLRKLIPSDDPEVAHIDADDALLEFIADEEVTKVYGRDPAVVRMTGRLVSKQAKRRPWPRERFYCGWAEYKRERPRAADEASSYMVSTTYGLLLGRVWRKPRNMPSSPCWWATGWTPTTTDKVFGPFPTRWEAIECLLAIEKRGDWPEPRLVSRDFRERVA